MIKLVYVKYLSRRPGGMKFFSRFTSWLLTDSEKYFLLRLDGDDDDDNDECLGVTYFSNGSAILLD